MHAPLLKTPFRFLALSLLGLCAAHAAHAQIGTSPLVPRTAAAQVGLERAWFAQIGADPAMSEVTAWTLHFDRIFGVSNTGTAFALDAETGERLWVRQVGKRGYQAFGPGANSKSVAIVSGSKIYVLDRDDGRIMFSRDLGSAPGAGPALTEEYAFVVLMTGRVEGYRLDDANAQPWYYNSRGRAFLRPVTTGGVVSWPTNAGLLYVSSATDPGLLYRIQTNDEIIAPPAELDGTLYIASLDGYLYSINGLTGNEQWRFATGWPIESRPAVVGNLAFVSSLEPAIHAINTKTGNELWDIPGASQFVAQGKNRVYAADPMGEILILDTKSGATLGTLATAEGVYPLVNDQTDRIFLVNKHGLVQCLHEIGASQPILHREMKKAVPKKADSGDADIFGVEEEATDGGAAQGGGIFDEAIEEPEEEPEVEDEPATQPQGDLFDDIDLFE